MKKIIPLILLVVSIVLTGCGKYGEKDVIKDLTKKIEKTPSYKLDGNLEIVNNDDVYKYKVDVSYKKDDYYKVSLTNTANSYEQIILKNKDGVYVVTPSLNKSFKFQSDWPYNGSQSYLLHAIVSDIENDKDKKVEETDEGIIVTTKTNYSNNKNLVSQKIYINKDADVQKVEVFDENGVVKIKMNFNDIDYDTEFDDNYYDLNSNMQASKTKDIEEGASSIDDTLYPMFLPTNTYLESENKVATEEGERVILTFAGEKPFTLVQESVSVKDEYETIQTFGEPEILYDTVGILDTNMVSWISGGVEYCLTSDKMSKTELLAVVSSISQVPLEK